MSVLKLLIAVLRYKKSQWDIRNQHPESPYLLKSMLNVADFEQRHGKDW